MGDTINWGIFKRRFWGELLRHQHSARCAGCCDGQARLVAPWCRGRRWLGHSSSHAAACADVSGIASWPEPRSDRIAHGRCYGASGGGKAPLALYNEPMERPMSQPFDASRSLTVLEQDSTIIAVIEMSQSKWLVSAVVPGVERQPLKKLDPDEEALRKLLHRWRNEAGQAGREIKSWRAGSPDKSVLIRTAAFSARRPWGHGKGDDQTQRT